MTIRNDKSRDTGQAHADKPGPESPPEMAALAQDFADLWQEQLSAMAADPSLASGMTETMKLWQQGLSMMGGSPPAPTAGQAGLTEAMGAMNTAMQEAMTTAMSAWTSAQAATGTPEQGKSASGGINTNAANDQSRPKTGATPPAGASDGSERLLHELDRRFTRLEERLDRLESGSASPGKGRGGKTGKSRASAAKPISATKTAAKKAASRKSVSRKSAAKKSGSKK